MSALTKAGQCEPVVKLGWNLLTHKPCSPDLAFSDSYPFGPLKDAIRGTSFEDDTGVIKSVKKWLLDQDKTWYW